MPRRLPDRFRPDSIAEFRAAARQRSLDAIALQGQGRRTAAVYLWGYVAEMILKAAFFEVSGFAEHQTITRRDLQNALATLPGIGGNPPLHHLGLWAQALVTLRASTPGLAYTDLAFGSQVTAKAYTLYGLWRETLRYHKNVAYPHELAQARDAAEWLLIRSSEL
jgi:hypothetical protein